MSLDVNDTFIKGGKEIELTKAIDIVFKIHESKK